MEYLSSERILIVDLEAGEVSEDDLDEELVAEKIGGAGITKALYEQHQEGEPIVLGAGPLTGTLYPASSLAVITAGSPVTGHVCHAPVTYHAGIELKYAGYDYVVIKGRSNKPVYLWIHDGVADISNASELWGKDLWETTDALRRTLGDDLIQVLAIGTAGEDGSDIAQVGVNYWSSGDRFAFGKLFGQKNLKGIALRGMGLLEIADPEAFVDAAFELLSNIKDGAAAGKKGVEDICTAMGQADVKDWLAPLVHRYSACYNTPYPSHTFVFLDADPKKMTDPGTDEPGFRVTDVEALLGFKKLGLSAEAACRLMKACAKQGVDAAAVAELSGRAGKTDAGEIEASLSSLTGTVSLPGRGIFSPWSPRKPLFGDFSVSGEANDWWERRMAVAYVFGIHPIFAVMAPELTEESMLEITRIGTELELDGEVLNAVVGDLLS